MLLTTFIELSQVGDARPWALLISLNVPMAFPGKSGRFGSPLGSQSIAARRSHSTPNEPLAIIAPHSTRRLKATDASFRLF